MPVLWNSTPDMLNSVRHLDDLIAAFCASQSLNTSMKAIQHTSWAHWDWDVVVRLAELFEIFAGPAIRIQADAYSIFNLTLLFIST